MPSPRFWRKATTPTDDTSPDHDRDSKANLTSSTTNDFPLHERGGQPGSSDGNALEGVATAETAPGSSTTVVYRTYKRRWFGLVQLTLMNIVVSWGVCLTFLFLLGVPLSRAAFELVLVCNWRQVLRGCRVLSCLLLRLAGCRYGPVKASSHCLCPTRSHSAAFEVAAREFRTAVR